MSRDWSGCVPRAAGSGHSGTVKKGFSPQPLYRRDRCHAILRAPPIELAGALVCGVVLQQRELRTLPPSPLFRCLQQLSADALALVLTAYSDLYDVAIEDLPMHWVGRPIQPCVDETNDPAAHLRDQSDALFTRVRRMLQPRAIARRDRLKRADRIALRINAGVILSTFQVHVRNSLGIVGTSWANPNRRWTWRIAHAHSILSGSVCYANMPHTRDLAY